MNRSWIGLPLAALTVLVPLAAEAHTGVGATGGFAHGFMHPIGGLDHILAMVAVGIWAAQIGGRALWLVPSAFVATMMLGGALGMLGVGLPMVELGIVGSIILLGLLIGFRTRLPVVASMAIVGLFAIFHGHAHGTEAPIETSGALYALGFAAATTLLHVAGIVAVLGATRVARHTQAEWGLRALGGCVAIAGVALLTA
jgi:urease accessory protein